MTSSGTSAVDDAASRPIRSEPRHHPRREKELPMLIVDAQIHLWNPGNPTTPWHRQIPAHVKAAALSEMDAGGVDAVVLTPHTLFTEEPSWLSGRDLELVMGHAVRDWLGWKR